MFFFQAEDGIRDLTVTGVQTCALPIWPFHGPGNSAGVLLTVSQFPGNVSGPGTRIWRHSPVLGCTIVKEDAGVTNASRSEEHTSELQSQSNLVCRLLLEKQKQSLRPQA